MASTIRISILADAASAVRGFRTTSAEATRTGRQLRTLERQVDRMRARNVNIDVKTRGFKQAIAEIVTANLILDRIRKGLPDLSFGLDGVARKFTLIAGAALAATAAALPLVGATVAIGAALGAATVGVGLFAAVAAPTFKAVTTAVGEYNTASHAYDRAKSIGDTKAMVKAQNAMASSLGALSPMQRAAALQTIAMNKAWDTLSASQAPVVLSIISHAASTLAQIIPKLTPAIDAMATVFKSVSDKAFTGLARSVTPFVDFIKNQGAPAFKSLAAIIGNLLPVIGHIATAFAPLGNIILSKLTPLTAAMRSINFDALAKSAEKLLPLVGTLLGNLGGALGNLVKAAAPLAGPVLKGLGDIAGILKTAFAGPEIKEFVVNIGKLVPAVAPIVSVLVTTFLKFADIISGQMVTLVPKLLPIVKQLADVFVNVLTGLSPLLPSLLDLVGIVVSFLPVLFPLITAFREAMIPVVKAVGEALIALKPSFAVIVGAFKTLLKPIAALIVAIVPLVPVLVTALVPALVLVATLAGDLVTSFKPLFPVLIQVIQALADGLQPVFKAIGDALPQIVTALHPLIDALLRIVVAVLPIIAPIGLLAVALIKALLPAALQLIPAIVEVADAIAKAMPDAIGILIPIITGLTSLISNPAFQKFGTGVQGTVFILRNSAAMFTFLWKAAKVTLGWLADNWRLVYAIVTGPIVSAVNYVIINWDKIRAAIVNGFNAVLTYFTSIPGKFLAAGRAIMQGLADGINAGLQWVRDKISSVGAFIPDWLKSVLGIHSPSAVMAEVGTHVLTGLAQGITSQVPHLKRTLSGVGDVIADGLAVKPSLSLAELSAGVTASVRRGATTTTAVPVALTGGSAAAPTVIVNINVAAGADPAEVGRVSVNAIEAYSRRTGRRFLVQQPGIA